jgi:DNA-binding response OmpR family regulator
VRRILIIEDDADIALSLRYNLEREGGYSVATAADAQAGLRLALAGPPDLVLLDLNLPGMDGIELCRQLRSREATAAVPIIMLTARVEEADRVRGLDVGADDYVTKPFSVKELLARVRAVLRRADASGEGRETLSAGVLQIDLAGRRVTVQEREVQLTRREFDLLADLVRNRGRVRKRERLLEQVWGYLHPGDTRTVDVHVRQLRKKLGPPADAWIETVVGVGYRFRETS